MMKKLVMLSMFLGFFLASTKKSLAQNNSLKGLPPSAIATTPNGYTMTEKINGKAYTAHAMMPPDQAGQIVGFYNGDKYIGLPYHKKDIIAGKKLLFSNENADLTAADDVGVYGGRKGQMEITKVTNSYAEGKFSFTGYSYDNKKTIEVSDGFFRVLLK